MVVVTVLVPGVSEGINFGGTYKIIDKVGKC